MRRQISNTRALAEVLPDRASPEVQEEIFSGGGELGARIRAFDWTSTPMGPISTWPQSLKTAVRILITSRYAMWMGWGPDLTFLYNDAYARMTLGKKHPWALGKPARDVWAEIWTDLDPRIQKVRETGEATWDEGLLLFLERNGYAEETYHTFSYSPLTGDEGKINGLLCVVTEETERVIGARQIASLRSLAAGLSTKITEEDVFAAIRSSLETNRQDLPFTLTYLFEKGEARARLASATGIDAGHPAAPHIIEVSDRKSAWPVCDLLSQRSSIVVENLAERFGAIPSGLWYKAPTRALLVPITRQGQDIPAGVLVAALNPYRQWDEGYSGFIDLVAGQIAAGIANAHAYQEERKRAEALAEIDKAKTAFFSNVSHEFRTPLTLMLGPTEDALATPEKVLRGAELETVYRHELRLLKLVNTLLDFSRLEAGRVMASYRSTDLAAHTTELASVFRSAMERAGLTYLVECEPLPQPVYVDHEMWEKIVLNLVSNALKSTFEGSIAVRLLDKSDHAELVVRDTGTGIPEEEINHLFERFRRIESARRRTHEGSGIGLALVHELLNMHGGTISVHSRMGEGSTFTVSLPYGSQHLSQDRIKEERRTTIAGASRDAFVQEALSWLPAQQAPHKESIEYTGPADLDSPVLHNLTPEMNGKARVLLVDDNRDMREYVRRLLSSRFEVITAENGRDALQKARNKAPDLVLSDVMMPEMDGLQLLAALRENQSTALVPVVLLSARAGEDSRIEGMQSGADDYLVKPFTARELLARVDAHIKIARFRREALDKESHLQRALRKSEREQQWLLAVVDQSPDFIGLTTMEGRVLYVNKSGRALVSLDNADDVRRLKIKDFFSPEGVPFLEDVVIPTALREGRWQGETRFRDFQTGRSFPVDYHVFPVVDPQTGDTIGLATVTRDMRERKKVEDALRASESRFRSLIEKANVGVVMGDFEGNISYVNPTMLQLLGYAADDVREGRLRWNELTPPEFAGRDALAVQQLRERGTCDPYEKEYKAKDGRRIPLLVSATMIVSADGARDEVAAFLADLTGLKRTEEALQTSEARLSAIYSSMYEYIGLLAPDGTVLDCNRASLDFAGNTREDVVGMRFWKTPWFIHTPGAPELLRQAIGRAAAGEFIHYEATLNRPSGEAIIFDFSLHPFHNAQGEVVYIVPEGRDITELKRAQSALLQSEKLAAVGRLSASIAHEINNPLEAVTNFLYLIEQSPGLPELPRVFARMAQQELARVSQIATQTLSFYRQPTAPTGVRMPELLNSVLMLYQGRLLGSNVNVVRDYRDSGTLICHGGELRQVFANLIGNALDASRNGGQITLRERHATDWRTGRNGVRVTVADNGHGMSCKTLARIFEPFFSTKSMTGTGLGLWVSQGIIQKHEGRIKVRSNVSAKHHGTIFSVFLPRRGPE